VDRRLGLKLSGSQCVAQEHRDRHRANATRDRRQQAGDFLDAVEVNVTDEACLDPVHPDVDHGGAGLDVPGTDQFRHTNGGDQYIGAPTHASEIVRT
jgi:hypothetical protein